MKNVYKKILFLISAVVMMVAFNMNVNASAPALTKSADEIANQTFIIGTHVFEIASDEPMTTKAIIDATLTIPNSSSGTSTYFYKNSLGEWILIGEETEVPATFILTKINGKVVVDEAEALAEAIGAAEVLLAQVTTTLNNYLVVVEEDAAYTNALGLVEALDEYIASETANTASILAQIEVLEGVLEDLEAAIEDHSETIILAARAQLARINADTMNEYMKYSNDLVLASDIVAKEAVLSAALEDCSLADIKNATIDLKEALDILQTAVINFATEINAAIAVLEDAKATLVAYTATGGSDSALITPVSNAATALDGFLYESEGVLKDSFSMSDIRDQVEALTNPVEPTDSASLSVLEALKAEVVRLQEVVIKNATDALDEVAGVLSAYLEALGLDDDPKYEAVIGAKDDLDGLLAVEYDYAAVINKTGLLINALEALEDATTVLEATALLASVQNHLDAYIAAGGTDGETVYAEVTSAESDLGTKLGQDPVIINDIETAVAALKTALGELDNATGVLENTLTELINDANFLLDAVEGIVTAYISVGGDNEDDPVVSVNAAKDELDAELDAPSSGTLTTKNKNLQDALNNLRVATVVLIIDNVNDQNPDYVYEDVLATFAAYNELEDLIDQVSSDAKDKLNAALLAILDQHKLNKASALGEAYGEYPLADYSAENQAILFSKKAAGLTAINAVSTVAEVNDAYDGAITAMENVPTIVKEIEQALTEAKTAAELAINNAHSGYTEGNYSEANWILLGAAKDTGLLAVDSAETIADVTTAQEYAIEAMVAIKTLAKELDDAKTAAKAEINSAYETYDLDDYSLDNQTALENEKQTGLDNVDIATIETIPTVKQAALDAMAAIKTLAVELAEAQAAAELAINNAHSGYTEGNYSEANWISLGAAKDAGLSAVAAATTTTEVDEAQGAAIEAMGKVLTLLAEAQAAAVEVLDATYEGYAEEDYFASNWTVLDTAYTNGGTAIGGATTVAGVEEVLQTALDGMAEVRNSDQSYALAISITASINTLPADIKTANEELITELDKSIKDLTANELSLIWNISKFTNAKTALGLLNEAIAAAQTVLDTVDGLLQAWIDDGGTELNLYWAVITAKQDLLEAIDKEVTATITSATEALEIALDDLETDLEP